MKIKSIICTLFILTVQFTFAQSNDSLICLGKVVLSTNAGCRDTLIEFTVILGTKPLVRKNRCLEPMEFEKMNLRENDETHLAYIFEKKENGVIALQDFVINKVDGTFGLGRSAPNNVDMDVLSINGKCKKVVKLIN